MRNAKGLATLALRRLQAARWLAAAGPSLLVATAVATIAMLACRALGWPGWSFSIACFVAVCVMAFRAMLALRPAPSLGGAAAEVDERLGLEGRVSTALALVGRDDPFARAAVEDGESVAAEAGRQAQARRAFPVGLPASLAWWPVALAAFVLVAWMVPVRAPTPRPNAVADAVAPNPADAARRAEQAESRVSQAVATLGESPEARERMADLLAELERPPAAQPAESREGAEADADARRESQALQRAAALEERLGRELDAPEMLALTQFADSLARLPELKGEGAKLSEALKQGDLAKSMQEMERLSKQAAGNDPKASAEAKQALEQLAAAMQQSAQAPSAAQQQALDQSLRQAGLDPQLAKDAAAAQAAAEKAVKQGACTPAQAQQVARQAQAQQQSQQQQRQMAQSMRDCKGGSCSSANAQLSRQQAQRRMQVALNSAMRQCKDASSAGWSMAWQRPKPQGGGVGKGGAGGGKPGSSGAPRTDGHTKELSDSRVGERQESAGDGDPLDATAARDFVRAHGAPAAASQEQVRAVVAKVAEGLEEGSEEDPVPARLKAAHKRYFEQWKRRVDPAGASTAPKPAGP